MILVVLVEEFFVIPFIVSDILTFDASLSQDEGEESEIEADDGDEEKILRNWSVLKSNQQLQRSKVINITFSPSFLYLSLQHWGRGMQPKIRYGWDFFYGIM